MDHKPAKSPTLAGILSGLMPGLGQFYCRQGKKGAGFLVGALLVDGLFGVTADMLHALSGLPPDNLGRFLLGSGLLLAVAIWSIVDAVRTAKHHALSA